MTIILDKDDYIAELETALDKFYEAKAIGDKEQIKYFQGLSKGIILILSKLKIVDNDELKDIVKNAELDSPSVFRN